MRYKTLALLFCFLVAPGLLRAQTKLKVAYPTTVGSMAVVRMTKEARLFEKHGLEVALIYIAGSSRVVQAMWAKDAPISESAIPAVIQANSPAPSFNTLRPSAAGKFSAPRRQSASKN